MKVFPAAKLVRVLKQVAELMGDHPDAEIDLRLRGTWQLDKEGDVEIDGEVAAPAAVTGSVDAELGAGWRSQWDNLGAGEFSLRIHRPASS